MRVYNHSASVLVIPDGVVDKVLLNEYDDTYRTEVFRRHFNLIGGNSEGDSSPLATLERELAEELGSSSPYVKAILENLQEHADYLMRGRKEPLKWDDDYVGLVSVYVARLDRELFEEMERDIREGRQSSSEGSIKVVTIDDLKEGKPRGGWGYGKITSDMLGTSLPEYEWFEAKIIGRPRSSFREYKTEFEYQKNPE